MATLKAQDNIPLQVGPLKYDGPKECPAHDQYGRSWMYGTENGDAFYADDKCHGIIQAAGVRKGSTFTVTKGKESVGRTNKWTVTGAGAAPSNNGQPTAAPRAAGSLTWADVCFAHREAMFSARADCDELASLKEDGPKPTFDSYLAAAAVRYIDAAKAGCLPRAPKAKPNLDGEHTKVFLAWLAEYRIRPDIVDLWPGGKNEWTLFIEKTAGKAMVPLLESNDQAAYEQIKTLIIAETAYRASQPMESGEADDIPY